MTQDVLQQDPGQGKPMHRWLDLSRSFQAALAVSALPNHCFFNAWRTLMLLPELFRPHGRLIEGWCVIEDEQQVVVNEHGWCERADGMIVDPSLILLVPPDHPVFYFPGVSRSWEETEALEGELFPHVRFDGQHGADGLGHADYRAAYEAAKAQGLALAQATTPPKALHCLTAQAEKEGAYSVPYGGTCGVQIIIALSGQQERRGQ